MASVRLMKMRSWVCLAAILVIGGVVQAGIATFDDLTLPPESYWNGADGSGGFVSGGMHFGNTYDVDWGSWDGFSYSNVTDTITMGFMAQYNAVTGGGQGGSANYGVVYGGGVAPPPLARGAPGGRERVGV